MERWSEKEKLLEPSTHNTLHLARNLEVYEPSPAASPVGNGILTIKDRNALPDIRRVQHFRVSLAPHAVPSAESGAAVATAPAVT